MVWATDCRIDNELFVVQINQVSNASFMNPCDFPEHVQHLLQRMKEDDENQKIAEEKEKNTCSVQLYCHHPKRGRIDMPLKVTTAARKEYQKRKKAIWKAIDSLKRFGTQAWMDWPTQS